MTDTTAARDQSVSRNDRWTAHPMAARALRLAIRLSPVTAAAVVSWQLSDHLRATALHHRWPVFFGIAAVSLVLAIVVERLARRLLPLTTLLALTMLFPDLAPTRWKVARKAGRPTQVEQPDPDLAEHSVALLAMLTSHDRRTRGHSERVRLFADMLGQELRLSRADADRLRWAALLHDVGKVEVSATLLNKPGLPTPKEWKQLRAHPATGSRMAGPLLPWLGEWGTGILEHHERFDGTGYPTGRRELEISRAGRAIAVVDAYEVMTAARSYKRPMSVAKARAELANSAGSHFDPAMVRAFLAISLPRLLWTTGPLAFVANLPFLTGFGTAARTLPALATPATAAAGVIAAGSIIAAVPAAANPTHPATSSARPQLLVSQGPTAGPTGTGSGFGTGSGTGSGTRSAARNGARSGHAGAAPTAPASAATTAASAAGSSTPAPTPGAATSSAAPGPSRSVTPGTPVVATSTSPPRPTPSSPVTVPTTAPTTAPTARPTPSPTRSGGYTVTLSLAPPKSSGLGFALFGFGSPDGTRYRYELDNGTVYTATATKGQQAYARYPTVGRGQRTFRVQAVDADGSALGPVTTYTWTVT